MLQQHVSKKGIAPVERPDMSEYSDEQLIDLFADKAQRNDAIVALVGGLTATELKHIVLTDARFTALTDGLKHENPKVRWWCLQLLDHIGDERCVPYVTELLSDPVPRVAKHAKHVLECEICKPSADVVQRIQQAKAEGDRKH